MTKLDQLIMELCPNGVEYKPLGDVINYEQPTKYIVNNTNYSNDYDIPVLTAGQTFILGYTNEQNGIYQASKDSPVIIFDDFTTSFHWVDFSFKVKSSAMKMLTAKDKNITLLKYLYYTMKCIKYEPVSHARQWIEKYSTIKIPVPPLPIQQEIVRILDKYTELEIKLEAEIGAELEARKKQYDYYRNLLFMSTDDIPIVPLGTIGTNLDSKRKPVTKNVRQSGKYPYYGASGIVDYVNYYIFDGDFLLVSEDGANLVARNTPIAFSASGKIWVNNHAHILQFNTYATRRYIEFYLNSIDLSRFISTAAQPKLNQENLNKIPIPLPSIEEQARIVSILDRFDALINDITSGLPAEITARRKQYEYYRDKLLTFKEIA
jgi:type I restriction enzyme S subunit